MGDYQQLGSIDFSQGINPSAASLSAASQSTLGGSTWNSIISGNNLVIPYKGSTTQGNGTGARKMLPFSNTWATIKDLGLVIGSGSFLLDIGASRWGIGSGQAGIEGIDVPGFILTTNLQLQVASGGVYGAVVDAGLSQPSALEVGIINTVGVISNSMSAKCARSRPATGAVSVASPMSAVVNPSANQLRATFPLAASGQTHWRIYWTFQGFGGTGIAYLGLYQTFKDIPETVVAAGVVDGIERSLAFNFQDGDLLPIEASFDDYPPPAGTHLLRLQTIMAIAGCYADSSTGPTTSDPGTAIAISKENDYESYVPTSLLFLPEAVVDTLARPIDDYGYIGCQNGIFALQYVGDRGDGLPPCTITTILPDIGIEFAHNWCHFRGQLLIYTAQGNLILMDEQGNFDTTFAGPVTKILKTFTAANTAVGYDPLNDALLVMSGKHILFYSLQMRQWRQIWLPDYGMDVDVVCATTAKRKCFFTVTDGSTNTAYSFDTANDIAPLSFVCNYQNNPGGNGALKDIYELAVTAESDINNDFALCISKNQALSQFRRISVTTGSATIENADVSFYAGLVGEQVLLFGDNLHEPGTVLFRGIVSGFTDANQITLTDTNGNPFDPITDADNLLMFVGHYTAVTHFETGNFANFFPNSTEMRSFQLAMWFKGQNAGNVLAVEPFGDAYSSSRALGS